MYRVDRRMDGVTLQVFYPVLKEAERTYDVWIASGEFAYMFVKDGEEWLLLHSYDEWVLDSSAPAVSSGAGPPPASTRQP